ncbi:MAG: hypothetical protein ACTHK7_17550, partial [Aureliella sp.]
MQFDAKRLSKCLRSHGEARADRENAGRKISVETVHRLHPRGLQTCACAIGRLMDSSTDVGGFSSQMAGAIKTTGACP